MWQFLLSITLFLGQFEPSSMAEYFSGPAYYSAEECLCWDFDEDEDVDLVDYSILANGQKDNPLVFSYVYTQELEDFYNGNSRC